MEVVIANKEVILVFLLALSEVLGLIPAIKVNSVFGLVVAALKKIKEVLSPKAE